MDIYTDVDLERNYRSLKASREPPIYCISSNQPAAHRALIHFNDHENRSHVNPDGDLFVVHYPSSEISQGQSLFYMAYSLLERELQEDGLLTCHSACVVVNGKGILLLGQSGSGKTSVVLQLCMRSQGQLRGNNFCVLGLRKEQLIVVQGTQFLHLRYAAIQDHFPQYLHLFPPQVKDRWNTKRVVLPNEIGIPYYVEPVVIDRIYLLFVDKSMTNSVEVKSLDSLSTRLYLHENFARFIRGTCLAALSDDHMKFVAPIPSLDTLQCFTSRVAIMDAILKNRHAKSLAGSLEQLVSYIIEDTL